MFAMAELVEPLDEVDRLEVLVAAEDVGDPLAGFARVVEVEHRGDGIDAQAVEVVAIEPEERIAEQEVADLGPAVVEDLGAPVAVLAEPGVGMLVEMRAVEVAQAVRVVGEVGGNPVEDDPVAMLVQRVDEVGEVVGRAESRRRGEVADRLVAPAAVERVLGDRHQLDVRELRVLEVGDQLVGQLAIVEKRIAVLAASLPRAQVNLVNRDRLVEALPLRPVGDPFVVVPGKLGDVPDDRGGLGPQLGGEAVRVGLVNEIAVMAALDLVLVDFALAEVGNEDLPDPRRRRDCPWDAGGRPSD